MLDLVLLRPRVFLHLLFNRGTLPLIAGSSVDTHVTRSVSESAQRSEMKRTRRLKTDFLHLVGVSILAEAAIRTIRLSSFINSPHSMLPIPYTLGGVLAELSIQLGVSTVLASIFLSFGGFKEAASASTAHRAEQRDPYKGSDGRTTHFQ